MSKHSEGLSQGELRAVGRRGEGHRGYPQPVRSSGLARCVELDAQAIGWKTTADDPHPGGRWSAVKAWRR